MNIGKYIEHTLLQQTTALSDIERICHEARQHGFSAVCIPPLYVKKAKEYLSGSDVKVSAVIGFPMGYSAIEAKLAEIVLAVVDGVDILEMVINVSAIRNGDWGFIANEINTIMPFARVKNKMIGIIIEEEKELMNKV